MTSFCVGIESTTQRRHLGEDKQDWLTLLHRIGKYKQGDVWLVGQGDVPCPAVCRNDKYQTADGYPTPANNQLIALPSIASCLPKGSALL